MCAEIILIGTVSDGLRGNEGKMPIKDESLNKLAPIVSYFMEESTIKGALESVLDLKLNVHKSNRSTIMIFFLHVENIWCGTQWMELLPWSMSNFFQVGYYIQVGDLLLQLQW